MTIIELAWSASIHWLTSDCHVSINVDFIYAMLVDEKEVRLTTARETLEKEFAAVKRKYMKACKEERDYLREKKHQKGPRQRSHEQCDRSTFCTTAWERIKHRSFVILSVASLRLDLAHICSIVRNVCHHAHKCTHVFARTLANDLCTHWCAMQLVKSLSKMHKWANYCTHPSSWLVAR